MLLKDSASASLVAVRAPRFLITDCCWITQLHRFDLDQALARCHFSVKSARAHAMMFVKSSFQPLWKLCGWCPVQHKGCPKLPVPLSKNEFEPARWKFSKFSCKRLALYIMCLEHSLSSKRYPENWIYLPIKSETEVPHPNYFFKQFACFHRAWSPNDWEEIIPCDLSDYLQRLGPKSYLQNSQNSKSKYHYS